MEFSKAEWAYMDANKEVSVRKREYTTVVYSQEQLGILKESYNGGMTARMACREAHIGIRPGLTLLKEWRILREPGGGKRGPNRYWQRDGSGH